ncbi:hypothetical protein [Thiolapillus sp.]|uniref:hypothetical protein n=1 Tax=Thiolapillus sp. TaxID=2017437 RepID=UPI003AF80B51
MTRTSGAPLGCQRPSRFWGLGCPKIYHEVEDTLGALISERICGVVRACGWMTMVVMLPPVFV